MEVSVEDLFDKWNVTPKWQDQFRLQSHELQPTNALSKALNVGIVGFNSILNVHKRGNGGPNALTGLVVPTSYTQFIDQYSSNYSCQMLFLPNGSLLLFQSNNLTSRQHTNNFNEIQVLWEGPFDPNPQWRRMCATFDGSLIAISTSQSDIYIIDASGRLLEELSSNQLGITDGIATILFHDTICELEGTNTCSELLILGFDGIIRRLHILRTKDKVIVHPLPGTIHNKSCEEQTKPIDLHVQHISVATMDIHPDSGLLVVGGSQTDATNEQNIASSISIWKLRDSPPYSQLMHSTNSIKHEGGFLTSLLKKFSLIDYKSITCKTVFSTSGKLLATLDLVGVVNIWDVQSFKIIKTLKENTEDLAFSDISWWSENILVIAQRNGNIILRNIIDNKELTSIEKVEKFPSVTSAQNGKFFILEYKQDTTIENIENVNRIDEEPNSAIYTIASAFSFGYLKQSKLTSKLVKSTYNLICYSKSTPMQLYQRRIEQQKYEEALQLAKKYNLDTDILYQQQWLNSTVTEESLEVLSKIKNRKWVLLECQRRIPRDYASIKLLLSYGLTLTPESRNKHLKEDSLGLYYRLIFLHYLDRLNTYHAITENGIFDPVEYSRFRDMHIVNLSAEYAYQEDFKALKILFTYHGKETLPFRLYILSSIPETTSPALYQDLLPELDLTYDTRFETTWTEHTWRERDWLEVDTNTLELLELPSIEITLLREKQIQQWKDTKQIDLILQNPVPSIRQDIFTNLLVLPEKLLESAHSCQPFYPADAERLTKWFLHRAREIDSASGQLHNALVLINFGIKRGISGLEKIQEDFQILHNLVYKSNADLSFEQLETLSSYEILTMLLKYSTEDTIIKDINERALIILGRESNEGELPNTTNALHKLMVDFSRAGKLRICERICRESIPTELVPYEQRIIKNPLQLIESALTCIYECNDTNQLDVMNEIFGCLPAFDESQESIFGDVYTELHNRIDQFELHLSSSEVLSKYELAKPLFYFLQFKKASEDSKEEAKKLLQRMCRKCIYSKIPLGAAEWRNLLQDMLLLREKLFVYLDTQYCYSLFLESALKAAYFDVAKEHIGLVEDVQPVLLSVAREFFNAAVSGEDLPMQKAKKVLGLAPNTTSEILEELNLIKAVQMLTSQYDYTMLPLKIRNIENRIDYIEKILENNPDAHRDPPKLIRLASLLTKTDSKVNSHIHMLIAKSALKYQNYTACYEACSNLIKSGYSPIWTVCRDLGMCDYFRDIEKRMQMLAYASSQCHIAEIDKYLSHWRKLESKQTYLKFDIAAEEKSSTLLKFREVVAKTTAIESAIDKEPFKLSSEFFYLNESIAYFQKHTLEQKTAKTVPPIEEINQKIVRLNANNDGELIDNDELLLELSEHYVTRDTPLSFSYLLSLTKTENANKLFDKLLSRYVKLDPSAEEKILTLACYFFYVKFLSVLSFRTKAASLQEMENVLHYMSPLKAIQFLEKYCADQYQRLLVRSPDSRSDDSIMQDPTLAENLASIERIKEHLSHYITTLKDSLKGREIMILQGAVDVPRFAKDEGYRRDVILNLAKSLEEQKLQTAFNLASQYGITEWDIAFVFVDWLISSADADITTIRSRMRHYDVILLHNPTKLLQSLSSTYEKISGMNYAGLTYFYELVSDCHDKITIQTERDTFIHEEKSKECKGNIRMLEVLQKVNPPIDWKRFQGCATTSEQLSFLVSNATDRSISNVAKLSSLIPSLSESMVYRAYILKCLQPGDRSLHQRYENLVDNGFFSHLEAPDIQHFINNILLGHQGWSFPLDLRRNFANDLLEVVEQQSSQKKLKDELEKCKADLESMLPQMKLIVQIEDFLKASVEGNLCMEKLQQLISSKEKFTSATHLIMISGAPLAHMIGCFRVIHQLQLDEEAELALYDQSKITIPTVVNSLDGPEDKDFVETWPPQSSTYAIQSISRFIKSIKYPYKNTELKSKLQTLVVTLLKDFVFDNTKQTLSRVKVTELLLQPNLKLQGLEKISLQLKDLLEQLQVSAIIGETWQTPGSPGGRSESNDSGEFNENIDNSENLTEEQKVELFNKLLLQSPSQKHLRYLATLLNIWNHNEPTDTYHECWYKLFETLVKRNEWDLVASIREENAANRMFTSSEEESLFKLIEANGHKKRFMALFKLGLLCKQSQLVERTADRIIEFYSIQEPPTNLPSDIIRLILISNPPIISKFAASNCFTQVSSYLVRQCKQHPEEPKLDNPMLILNYVIADLCISHHHILAAGLLQASMQRVAVKPPIMQGSRLSISPLQSLDTSLVLLRKYLSHKSLSNAELPHLLSLSSSDQIDDRCLKLSSIAVETLCKDFGLK